MPFGDFTKPTSEIGVGFHGMMLDEGAAGPIETDPPRRVPFNGGLRD